VCKGQGYGRQADIWSVGCIVVEMLTSHHPWPEFQNPLSALYAIAQAETGPPLPDGISDDCASFLKACFTYDPSQRPTANKLLQHPFVARSNLRAANGLGLKHSL